MPRTLRDRAAALSPNRTLRRPWCPSA